MLIRFQIKNLYSFGAETEFNLLTNHSEQLSHHKKHYKGIDILRLSAIYGANASGKSNFVRAIALLQRTIREGKIMGKVNTYKFRLNKDTLQEPISLAIEFLSDGKIYYYTLTFDHKKILNETLLESFKERDRIIFERSLIGEKQEIPFIEREVKDEKERLFLEILSDKLLGKEELLLTFLSQKYPNEYPDIDRVYNWFSRNLVVLSPTFQVNGMVHSFDANSHMRHFINTFIPNLSAGIERIYIEKEKIENTFPNLSEENKKELIDRIRKEGDGTITLYDDLTNEEVGIVLDENEQLYTKRLFTEHLGKGGYREHFPLRLESDGTKRLLEYTPMISDVINHEIVYVVDEIERSIHPMMIKELIKKISWDTTARGQLIFTTHESCLLDQQILRTDEIWFTQKDKAGASHMYSLSDFNISNTANIEDGYLNGRYGGIPFLSNLKELNWHTDENISNEK